MEPEIKAPRTTERVFKEDEQDRIRNMIERQHMTATERNLHYFDYAFVPDKAKTHSEFIVQFNNLLITKQCYVELQPNVYTWEIGDTILLEGFWTQNDPKGNECTVLVTENGETKGYTYTYRIDEFSSAINLCDDKNNITTTFQFSGTDFQEILEWERAKQSLIRNFPHDWTEETGVEPMDTGAFCVPLRM